MEDEYQLVMSPLCRSITSEGKSVRLEIYRGSESDWTLEAVDAFNNSTVWDDTFVTDEAALDEALRTIRDEGISSLIGSPSGAA